MAPVQVLFLIALALQASAETKHGTIGFGITMYRPWCCTACSDVLSSLYLNCTTFDDMSHSHHGMVKRMDMEEPMGMTSPECYSTDRVWLETFSYCIKSHCDAEGVDALEQEQCWQKKAAGGLEVAALDAALPNTAPTKELAEDAEWLNSTMLVNAAKWQADRNTIQEFEQVEGYHSLFS